MQFAKASRFAGKHDVVLVGYRGVDGSSKLDCPEVESALKHSGDFLGQKSFRRLRRRPSGRALPGSQHDGVDLAGYSLPQRVDDLDAARRALGYGRIDLLSESAGTRTAMIYAWRHPKSIDRSVMIGVNPPGNFLWYPKTTDEQIQKYSAQCAKDAGCSKRTDDLAALLETKSRHIPDHWLFLPIKRGNVKVATFYGLMEATDAAAPLSGADDARHVARRRRGRRKRLLVHVADGRRGPAQVVRLGRSRIRRTGRRRRSAALLRGGPSERRLDPRQARGPTSSGEAARSPRRGPQARTTTPTATCAPHACRRW